MTEENTTPTSPARKKGVNITVKYVNPGESEPARTSKPACEGIVIETVTGYRETVLFADLPSDVVAQATAFGFSTALKNSFNTAFNNTDELDEALHALETRLDNMRNGVWGMTGSGEGRTTIPLVIHAMKRACENAGMTITEEKFNSWVEKYHSFDDKAGKAAQTKAWMASSKAVEHAYNTILAERAAEKAKSLKPKKADAVEGLAAL